MTRILLATSGWTPRTLRLAGFVARAGHETVIVAPRGAGRPDAIGEIQQVELEPHQYEGGHALAAVAYDFESEVFLAAGWMAALAVGMLPVELPNWIDVEESPRRAAAQSPACFDGGSEVGFWFRWVWSLDRVDRISAPDAAVADELVSLMASRGRIAGRSPAADVVVLGDPAAEGSDAAAEELSSWLRKPRRDPDSLRISGRREIGLAAEVERLQPLLDAERKRGATGRALRRALAGAGGAARTAASRIVVASSEAGDRLRGRSRSSPAQPRSQPSQPAQPAPIGATGRRPRMLAVLPYPIFPPRHGGAVRVSNLLTRLAADVDLSVFVFVRSRFDEEHRRALSAICRRVEAFHWRPASPNFAGELVPPNVRLFQTHQVAQRIRTIVEEDRIDVVQLETTEMAGYLGACGAARTIVVEEDIAYRTHQRRLGLEFASRFTGGASYASSGWDLRRIRRFEHRALRRADQIHAMSETDAEFLRRAEPSTAARIRVVPNGVDVSAFAMPASAERLRDILIVGNFENLPNLDGWEYFQTEIWPLVKAARPEATVTVAGAKLPESVKGALPGPGFEAHSDVPDLRPYYWSHRLLAVPIRAGSGTRLKILEAAAAGIPVVSTALGAEGLPLVDGRDLAIADSARAFADAILAALADPEAARARARSALGAVTRELDWSAIATRNLAAVRELVGEGDPHDGNLGAGAAPRDGEPARVAIVVAALAGEAGALSRTLESLARVGLPAGAEVVVAAGFPSSGSAEGAAVGARFQSVPGEAGSNLGYLFDAGARASTADRLIFLRAGVVVDDAGWEGPLLTPLARACPPGAVFGELATPRFRSAAERAWAGEYGGAALDPDLVAVPRAIWLRQPFSWARRMPDKWFQQRAWEASLTIETAAVPRARLVPDPRGARGLWREARIEGEEWRELGRRYRLGDALRDAFQPSGGTRLAAIARSFARWLGARTRPYWERSW